MAFSQIAIRELPTWIKVLRSQGITNKEEILKELTLIDDLLTLQKSPQSLLNRKRNLKSQLEARIGMELGHRTKNLNIKS
jgi:hypothetical protein